MSGCPLFGSLPPRGSVCAIGPTPSVAEDSLACALPLGVSWLAAKQRGGGAGLRGMLSQPILRWFFAWEPPPSRSRSCGPPPPLRGRGHVERELLAGGGGCDSFTLSTPSHGRVRGVCINHVGTQQLSDRSSPRNAEGSHLERTAPMGGFEARAARSAVQKATPGWSIHRRLRCPPARVGG